MKYATFIHIAQPMNESIAARLSRGKRTELAGMDYPDEAVNDRR